MPKPIDFTAIAFGWPAFSGRVETRHGVSFLSQLLAQLAARLGFTVKRLRNRGGAAHLTEEQHFHLEVTTVVLHSQQVAHTDFTRGLGALPIGLDSAKFTGARSERARFEKPCSP